MSGLLFSDSPGSSKSGNITLQCWNLQENRRRSCRSLPVALTRNGPVCLANFFPYRSCMGCLTADHMHILIHVEISNTHRHSRWAPSRLGPGIPDPCVVPCTHDARIWKYRPKPASQPRNLLQRRILDLVSQCTAKTANRSRYGISLSSSRSGTKRHAS